MALKIKSLHRPSNLPRPSSYSFSRPSFQPSRVATTKKHHHPSPSAVLKLKCRANDLHGCSADEAVQTAEIPIVMYPSVVFPGATLQLQVFKFRYRIMMHTLLQQQGQQPGLVSFGVLFSGATNAMISCGVAGGVGCAVRVLDCEALVDDRFFLTCAAGDRFRVVEVVRTKPFVVARVQVLRDRPAEPEPPQSDGRLGALVRRVERHAGDVALLSDKLSHRRPWGNRQAAAELLRLHGPPPRSAVPALTFLVARLFVDDRLEQQALLETDDAAQRLAREGVYLEHRSKYLAAIAAIKEAFQHLSCN
ncbi:hypothetical protein BS78_01G326500 [Paspalum vaginatum]|nr:hypothetical protein BS78_01G326500 [Paspalum vaginatum]KAJ1296755.1 hypothetical protein BS78_01G326500 [Paspalum vaginatum]